MKRIIKKFWNSYRSAMETYGESIIMATRYRG